MDGYNGKPYQNWWFGGTTIFGNIQMMKEMVGKWLVISLEHPFYLGSLCLSDTVDGRNPKQPVDMVNIPLFTGFYTSQVVGLGISEPSTISHCWDSDSFKHIHARCCQWLLKLWAILVRWKNWTCQRMTLGLKALRCENWALKWVVEVVVSSR